MRKCLIPCHRNPSNNKVNPTRAQNLTLLVISNEPGIGKSRWIYRIGTHCFSSSITGGDRSSRFLPTLGFDVTQKKNPAKLGSIRVLTFYEVGGLTSLQSLWPGYIIDSDGVVFMASRVEDLEIFRQKVLPVAKKSLILVMNPAEETDIKSHHLTSLSQPGKFVKVAMFDPIDSYSDLTLISWFISSDQTMTTTKIINSSSCNL